MAKISLDKYYTPSDLAKYTTMKKYSEIQIECEKCGSISIVNREFPEKAISMKSDKCPECTELLCHYTGQTWIEWYIDKDGNKF